MEKFALESVFVFRDWANNCKNNHICSEDGNIKDFDISTKSSTLHKFGWQKVERPWPPGPQSFASPEYPNESSISVRKSEISFSAHDPLHSLDHIKKILYFLFSAILMQCLTS